MSFVTDTSVVAGVGMFGSGFLQRTLLLSCKLCSLSSVSPPKQPNTLMTDTQEIRKENFSSIQKLKNLAVRMIKYGIASVNPRHLVPQFVQLKEQGLVFGKHVNGIIEDPANMKTIPLSTDGENEILVLGMGKATAEMLFGLVDTLSPSVPLSSASLSYVSPYAKRLRLRGLINVPCGQQIPSVVHNECVDVQIHAAGHPIPDENTLVGTQKQLDLIRQCAIAWSETPRSHTAPHVVIVLVSGGGSALFEVPVAGISLEDMSKTTSLLLRSGANINELNAVRKHLSLVKGGQLARWIVHENTSRGVAVEVIALILSDVIGDRLDVIASGPTVPDPTTYQQAVDVCTKYAVWDALPLSVQHHLRAGVEGRVKETPKEGDSLFAHVTNFLCGSARTSARAVATQLQQLGFDYVRVFSDSLQGEAREFGRTLPQLMSRLLDDAAKEISQHTPDSNKKDIVTAAFIGTGEFTVTVRGKGIGGRNQEMLLSFLHELHRLRTSEKNDPFREWDWVVISAAFDGIEGNSPAMGALVASDSLARLEALKQQSHSTTLNLAEALNMNNSFPVFEALGDALIVGHTGTNVNDMTLILFHRRLRPTDS